MVPVRAVKRNVLAGSQVRVTVVLVAGRAESGSAKCAFGHTYCLPGGWRSLSATLDTRTRFPLPAPPTPFPACFGHVHAYRAACARLKRPPGGSTGRVR